MVQDALLPALLPGRRLVPGGSTCRRMAPPPPCHPTQRLTRSPSSVTFLNLAAPVPERMASIKACLASTGLSRGPELDLDTALDVGRAGAAGGAGGGWAGGG